MHRPRPKREPALRMCGTRVAERGRDGYMLRMEVSKPATEQSRLLHALLVGALALVVCAVFWPMLGGQFVYDDLWLAAQNPSLQSLGQLWSSLGGSYWDFIDAGSSQYVGYWRPLTSATLYLGNALTDGSPLGFHVLSLALHAVAVALAFALALRLSRDLRVACFVALLFGLHPVQVEPVAWISSVNDPLSGVFSLGAMWAFVAWRERASRGLPLASAALFLCALLAKESALAVLPMILAVDLGRESAAGNAATLRERLQPFVGPYATLCAAFALYYVSRIAVFGDAWAGFDRTTGHLGLTTGREISRRIEFFGGALGLLSWPRELNLFRDLRPQILWSDQRLWTAVGFCALYCVAVWRTWRIGSRAMLAGLLLILAALLPAIVRIEALGRFSLSERYLYLSVFGFALYVVLALRNLAARYALKNLAWMLLLLVAALLGWHSRGRTHVWQDERTLFAQSFLDNPKSPYVAWGLGRVMMEDYRRSQQIEFLAQARAAFELSQELGLLQADGSRDMEVLVTQEDRLQANLGLGWYYFFAALSNYDETTLDEALAVFERTLAFFPTSYEATTGVGVVQLAQGNLVAAAMRFRAALELNDKHLEAWYYLGKAELRRGDAQAAKIAFERALALKPDDVDTLPLYAGVLSSLGDDAAAQRALELAHGLAPQDVPTLMGLGAIAARNKDAGSALSWFDQVLKLDPDFAAAHLQKGKVLVAVDQTARALLELQRACELDPGDFEAHYTLGVLLISQGLKQESLPFLERALSADPNNPLAEALRAQIEELRGG
jgi:tetratricopeptide (TPR) repeat protein